MVKLSQLSQLHFRSFLVFFSFLLLLLPACDKDSGTISSNVGNEVSIKLSEVFVQGNLDYTKAIHQLNEHDADVTRQLIPIISEKAEESVFKYMMLDINKAANITKYQYVITKENFLNGIDLFTIPLNEGNGEFYFYQNVNAKKLTNERITIKGIMRGQEYDIASRNGGDFATGKCNAIDISPISNCVDWYWVVYDNETGNIVSMTYLYTECITPPCAPDLGGGGGGSTNNNTTVILSHETYDEPLIDEMDGAGIPRIKYTHTASAVQSNGHLIGVTINNTTAAPMYSNYVDNQGRNTTRKLTLFGHANSWTRLSTNTVLVNWSWYTHYLISFENGGEHSFSRSLSSSKVFNF